MYSFGNYTVYKGPNVFQDVMTKQLLKKLQSDVKKFIELGSKEKK